MWLVPMIFEGHPEKSVFRVLKERSPMVAILPPDQVDHYIREQIMTAYIARGIEFENPKLILKGYVFGLGAQNKEIDILVAKILLNNGWQKNDVVRIIKDFLPQKTSFEKMDQYAKTIIKEAMADQDKPVNTKSVLKQKWLPSVSNKQSEAATYKQRFKYFKNRA